MIWTFIAGGLIGFFAGWLSGTWAEQRLWLNAICGRERIWNSKPDKE